jgi:hypothetical protein
MIRYCTLLIFIMGTFMTYSSRAEESPSVSNDTIYAKISKDPVIIWKATTYDFTAPKRWGASDWKKVGLWSAAVVGAVLVEEDIRDWFQDPDNRGDFGDDLAELGDLYGAPHFTVTLSLATWGTGALFRSPKIRETGLMLIENMLIVGVVQQPLRMVVGRARPQTGEGNLSFNPFTTDDAYASFISGHSWSAFGVSTILAKQINRTWATVGLYGLALATPLSRMYDDKHWFSDVLIGSVMGYYSARTIWSWHKEGPGSVFHLAVIPTPKGITISARF